jgi:hypothetical protein
MLKNLRLHTLLIIAAAFCTTTIKNSLIASSEASTIIECSVCLEEKPKIDFTQLQCKHLICTTCITSSTFDKKNGCPECRAKIAYIVCNICKKQTHPTNQNILPCDHVYHSDCLNKIIARTGMRCPDKNCQKPFSYSSKEQTDTSEKTQNNATTKKISYSREIGAACLVGAISKNLWNKHIAKENSRIKKIAKIGAIAAGTAASYTILNYLYPERKNYIKATLGCWALGFSLGTLFTDLFHKKKPENQK